MTDPSEYWLNAGIDRFGSVRLRMTIDPVADAASIRVAEERTPDEFSRSVVVNDEVGNSAVIVDLDHEGRLLGIEILGASRRLRLPLGEFTSIIQ